MRKEIIILVILGVFLLLPTLVSADCVDLGKFTSWVFEGENKIIFHMG